MPLSVRVPHTLEMPADSFVVAGALTVLLAQRGATGEPAQEAVPLPALGHR